MGGKRKKRRCRSSSDEEDHVPLQLIRTSRKNCKDDNCYDCLRRLVSQQCELCNHISKNRYNSYIHNVRHIIIPLINLTVYQCNICLHYFTSQNELGHHKSDKHSLNLVTDSNTLEDELYESDLVTVVKHEYSSPSKTENPPALKTSHSIKNRLLFEEDITASNCDKLLEDLTIDCQVKMELIPPIWETSYPNSIHYNDLMNPGVFRCKKCSKTFPSRYLAITHEASHIFFKDSQVTQCDLCKQYILGDINKLKQHIDSSHAQGIEKKYFGPKYEENGILEQNGGSWEQNGDIDGPYVKTLTSLKFCEFCYAFCRNAGPHRYNCVGELSKQGKRYKCHKCGYKFFVVKLVNRETRYSSFHNKGNKKSHVITNHERLKNIAQRLKKMRKYFLVLFRTCYPCMS